MRNGLILNETIGKPECPLMRRWLLNTPIGTIRVHRFLRDDDDRDPHDHPWWFLTIVLRGGYTDVSLPIPHARIVVTDVLRAGHVRFRKSHHTHWVRDVQPGCTTLIITGPQTRSWGFRILDWGHAWLEHTEYFKRYGHKPCPADERTNDGSQG